MEISYPDLAGILDFPAATQGSPLRIIDRIQQGLPVTTLYHVSERIAPGDAKFVFLFVPKASLARRKRRAEHLTAEESNKVARAAGVWKLAENVWQNEKDARAFLLRSHPMLEGRRPIDVVLESEFGADLVRNILGRLQYGSAA